jgi:hypothetical protein
VLLSHTSHETDEGVKYFQRSPNKRLLPKGEVINTLIASHNKKKNSQRLGGLAKYRRPAYHLACPHVTDEPTDVANGAPDEVARSGAPSAGEQPGEGDEGKREVWGSDGDEAKERYGCGRVSSGPKVDGHVGEG